MSYVIPVVRNTFQVIHELSQTGALTLNEAARRTGIPKSTAFRILATLIHIGVAIRDPEQKTYRLGRRLSALAKDDGATEALRRGNVLALKGVGGFQLIVDARNDDAVRTLRARKGREEKPFALMFPSLGALKAACEVSELEER